VFFPQDTIPAIDLEGKIITKSSSEIFENPNGNGGCFIAMKKHKIMEELVQREIEYIHVISVDNPLTKVLDPLFVGLNIKMNSEISAKFIAKRDANEPVGLFVNLNGKATMIDYGDFPKQLVKETNSNGKLRFNTSNILNYLISVKYLSEILGNETKYNQLIFQFNYARKKIDGYDIDNKKEGKVEGIKFELFFNSIFTFAETEMVLLEIDRNEEFAPIKNADPAPNDTPSTSRRIMSNLFKKWLGTTEIKESNDHSEILLEISFLKSYTGENLSEFPDKLLKRSAYIC
jgi:UDP-N-acetylglucosamine/UDP-N-acetylgalactosamine diphosphorylase